MKNRVSDDFEFEHWDNGRLTVNRAMAALLRAQGLTTFDAFYQHQGGTVAKNLLKERTTTRIELTDSQNTIHPFYLKRHGPSPWKEYIKPLLRLTRPILGARNEWDAILHFHELGIQTMMPVVLGESGRNSFLLTQSIENCIKLSDWMEQHLAPTHNANQQHDPEAEAIMRELGRIARLMHSAGMHHQDFYLTHFLRPVQSEGRKIHVIDLGRVRKRKHLSKRWIVKDLAQLNYSAHLFSEQHRQSFLEAYFDKPLRSIDRGLLQKIDRKSAAIARHSQKNQL